MTMNTAKVLGLVAATALAGSLAALPAAAATSSGTMSVTATVPSGCTVTTSNLDFGVYNGAAVNATSDITLVCTASSTASIALNAGQNAVTPNVVSTRQLNEANSSNKLAYDVFRDAAHSLEFGDTTGTNTLDNVSVAAGATGQTVTAYGRMPDNAGTLIAGTYTDSISVTVTY